MVGKSVLEKTDVDFDYDGPPVAVSNGMALDLVTQFGIQNAWYAFLKLRGMNLTKNEADKGKAVKHFRSKIQRIKKSVENLKNKPDEFNKFLNKEFNQAPFLEFLSTDTNKDKVASSEESDSGKGIFYYNFYKLILVETTSKGDNVDDISNSIPSTSSALKEEQQVTSNPPTSSSPTSSEIKKEILKEQEQHTDTSLKNSEQEDETSSFNQIPSTSEQKEIKDRQFETIDAVVSTIMHKIQNNEPFEGELSSQTRPTKKATKTTNKGKSKLNINNTAVSTTTPSLNPLQTTTALMAPICQQIIPDQITPVTKIITQQTNPEIITQIPSTTHFPTTFNISNLPLTLPTNVTVQALLQQLQQQAKKSQLPFQSIQLSSIQQQLQQQETPDSSSQDIVASVESVAKTGPINNEASKPIPKKRQPTKKKLPIISNEHESPLQKDTSSSEPSEKLLKMGDNSAAGNSTDSKNEIAKKKPGRKPLKKSIENEALDVTSESSSTKLNVSNKQSTSTTNNLKDEDTKKITELENQLNKLQKQLTAEKNKFLAQKKKMEKLQSDLEKNVDAIQIVQIDLSCQKADNNNLIAENIALKAENQQLRSKDSSSKAKEVSPNKNEGVKKRGRPGAKATIPKESTKPLSSSRKRGAVVATTSTIKVDTPSEIPELVEFGRRQSKRVTVPRYYVNY